MPGSPELAPEPLLLADATLFFLVAELALRIRIFVKLAVVEEVLAENHVVSAVLERPNPLVLLLGVLELPAAISEMGMQIRPQFGRLVVNESDLVVANCVA